MKMYNFFLKSMFIVIIIIISSCSQPGTTTTVKEQNNGTTQNPENINALVKELRSRGFDTNGYTISDGLIVVEGDICIDMQDLKKHISRKTTSVSGPMKQYRYKYSVSPQGVTDIKIYASLPANWDAILNNAINAWNNSGTAVHFRRVDSGYQNITVSVNNNSGNVYARALMPYLNNDLPGNQVQINDYNCSIDGLNQNQKLHILIHEIGHTIGLMHMNQSESYKFIIPGTPSSDNSSIMVYNVYAKSWASNPWAGFTSYDNYTNWYLFNNTTPYIILYQDIYYGGDRYLVRDDMSTLALSGYNFNDWASSVRVFNGAMVILWQHSDYKGMSLNVPGDIPDFTVYDFNDRASSVQFYEEHVYY